MNICYPIVGISRPYVIVPSMVARLVLSCCRYKSGLNYPADDVSQTSEGWGKGGWGVKTVNRVSDTYRWEC